MVEVILACICFSWIVRRISTGNLTPRIQIFKFTKHTRMFDVDVYKLKYRMQRFYLAAMKLENDLKHPLEQDRMRNGDTGPVKRLKRILPTMMNNR
jgi:hypothetical protein